MTACAARREANTVWLARMEPGQMYEPPRLGKRVRVVLFGLQGAPELNGRRGIVVAKAHDDRWKVRLEEDDSGPLPSKVYVSDNGDWEEKAVRATNLSPQYDWDPLARNCEIRDPEWVSHVQIRSPHTHRARARARARTHARARARGCKPFPFAQRFTLARA